MNTRSVMLLVPLVALALGGGCAPSVPPRNKPPRASALLARLAPVEESMEFRSASEDPDGKIVSLTWDFGDGIKKRGTPVRHTYRKQGIYTVTLKVTDDASSSSVASLAIAAAASIDPAKLDPPPANDLGLQPYGQFFVGAYPGIYQPVGRGRITWTRLTRVGRPGREKFVLANPPGTPRPFGELVAFRRKLKAAMPKTAAQAADEILLAHGFPSWDRFLVDDSVQSVRTTTALAKLLAGATTTKP